MWACFRQETLLEGVEKVIYGGDFIDLCPKIPPYLGVPHRFSTPSLLVRD